jgi:flagellar hook-basal body complex protein FliE
MINGVNVNGVGGAGEAVSRNTSSSSGTGTTSFADTLKKSIDDVSRLQQDASQAVTDLATGKTENMSGVMTAVEKSDLAFKTLLAIRSKLMDAYDEIKGMSV